MNLVKQTPREELLIKIGEMKKGNTTAKQQEEIERHEKQCAKTFNDLAWRVTGLSPQQVLQLNGEEFQELESLLADYAKPREKWGKINLIAFVTFVPVVSWMFMGTGMGLPPFDDGLRWMPSWRYRYHMKKLKKMCGDDYSLYRSWHKYYGHGS